LLFILYINDLLPTLNASSIPVTFVEDTSVIISIENLDDFRKLSSTFLSQMSKWFTANNLSLTLDKTNVIKFITKEFTTIVINIGFNDEHIEEGVILNSLVYKTIIT
jgi:hypothetical protein